MDKENFRIGLISLQEDAERVPPSGLVYLATYLRDVVGIPESNIKILDKNYSKIEEELYEFKPTILGFTSMTVNYLNVRNFVKKLKKFYDIPFILGGIHISSIPESLDSIFSVGVIGEGEITLQELVKLYLENNSFPKDKLDQINGLVFFKNNKIKITKSRNPIINLDSLPIPDFKFVKPDYFKKEEILSISELGIKGYLISSRGCPYRCVFCSTSRFWGNIRFHSVDYTARMAKKMIDDLNINYLKVADDLFTISVKRLKELKDAFEKYGVLDKINGIDCQPRANLINDDLCKAMKDLKIRTVNFGFESGSDKILSWLKQNSVTVEMNKKAILLCKKYGFIVYGSLIYGSPGETIEDMKKTNEFIDFASKHGANYLWSFVATPFPATPFWDIALVRGKVSVDMDWDLLSHHSVDDPLLLDDCINIDEFKNVFNKGRKKLMKMKLKIVFLFMVRNPFNIMKMILKDPIYYSKRIKKQILNQ